MWKSFYNESMTNKEKEEYINLKYVISLHAFFDEPNKIKFVREHTPRTLFKFRKFDEHTFDMIDNNYVYLANASSLDDPFDCLTSISSVINVEENE